jgi:hypothetical protein
MTMFILELVVPASNPGITPLMQVMQTSDNVEGLASTCGLEAIRGY